MNSKGPPWSGMDELRSHQLRSGVAQLGNTDSRRPRFGVLVALACNTDLRESQIRSILEAHTSQHQTDSREHTVKYD